MNLPPLVSVIMPVYNSEKSVKKAIESILNQTYQNIEFLIIDDASSDRSVEIIKSFKDKRIKLIINQKNLKVAACMNKALDLAKGKYLARMDADDVSILIRIEKQVEFLEKNENIGIVGGWVRLVGGMNGKIWYLPTNSSRVKNDLLFYNTLSQPTVMMRKSFFNKHHLRYNEDKLLNRQKCEDYELWCRCVDKFPCANLGKVLLNYHVTRAKIKKDIKEQHSPDLIRQRQILKYGFKPTKKELSIHQKIATQKISLEDLTESEQWLLKLGGNKQLRGTIAFQWFTIPRYLWKINYSGLIKLIFSSIVGWLSWSQRLKMIKMAVIKFGSTIKQGYTK